VRVRGNSIVPPTILGRFSILCAILRQLHLILAICVFSSELRTLQPTRFFVDQLSAGIPLLRILCPHARILFYCHFPDKLLAKKGGPLKTLYRFPFDWLESWSTGCSDGIVVNSNFTKTIFYEAFPRLDWANPKVVYPCVDVEEAEKQVKEDRLWTGTRILLSINRFERKKDVGLAIQAYAGLPEQERKNTRLVVAGESKVCRYYLWLLTIYTGGYDPRVSENVSYHTELQALADSLGLSHATAKTIMTALAVPSDISVLFLLSITNTFKAALLVSASLLVYTPRNEHFGIVPLEAMLAGVPVLAANEGGPVETVVEGKTGWLRDASRVEEWTAVLKKVLDGSLSEQQLKQIGENGKTRVKGLFSKERMAARFEDEIVRLEDTPRKPLVDPLVWMFLISLIPAYLAILYRIFM
jgi:alpha-1,3/alpha-1,6-mannosyltransferase